MSHNLSSIIKEYMNDKALLAPHQNAGYQRFRKIHSSSLPQSAGRGTSEGSLSRDLSDAVIVNGNV
tara:strand:+ start:616 stop:813 length:198 start_codon:yes stop_codon:yes gene_type:complete